MMPLRPWIGWLAFLLLLCGCQTHRYNDMVKPILASGYVDAKAEAIPLQLIDYESGQPVRGVTLFILSTNRPAQLVSDTNGWIQLPVLEEWRRENPRITNNYPRRLTIQASVTAALTPNGPPLK